MTSIVSPYIPHDRQIEAHVAAEQFVGYGGAMGGGKTRWLCEMSKFLSIEYPGNFGLVCRATGPALKLTVLEVMFSEVLVPGTDEWKLLGCVYNKSEGLLSFNRRRDERGVPSRVWFTGLDNANTERLKSLNLGFFGIEEATEVAESIFMMLKTRLRRKSVPQIGRKGLVTANPEAGWVKKTFVDQKLPNHKFVFANFRDNPHLPSDYPELFDTLPDRWKQKYLYGRWEAASGLIWKEFDTDFHLLPEDTWVPNEWLKVRGLDHGQQNPTACIGGSAGLSDKDELRTVIGDRVDGMVEGFDHYPVIVCSKLYYSPGLVSEHREHIYKCYKDWRPWKDDIMITTWADPSIWARDREKLVGNGKSVEYSIADEYLEQPFPLRGLRRANNQLLVGIDRVSMLFKIGHLFIVDNEELHPLVGPGGEVRNYSWKEPRIEDLNWPEQPQDKDNHACDALRYLAMGFPAPQREVQRENPRSFDAVLRAAQEHSRKRMGFIEMQRQALGWRSV